MSNQLSTLRYTYGSDGKGALIRVTPDGAVHSIQKKVRLTAEEGQWYFMSVRNADTGNYEMKKIITAKGYDYLRGIIGINFVSPDTIVSSDGREVGNPYLHEASGMLEYVKVRLIGACRGPSGNWQAQDLTFVFNFKAYLASDLFAKWHDKKSGGVASWGKLINTAAASPCSPSAIRVPVSMGVELEVDLGAKEVRSIFREHLEKQKFAERNAYSMAARNIMRKLLGLYYVEEDNTVTITIWPQADKDLLKLGDVVQRAKQGSASLDGDVIDVEVVETEATEEDIEAANDSDVDVEAEPEPAKEEPKVRDKQAALDDLRKAVEKIPEHPEKPKHREEFIRAAFKLAGFKTKAEVTKPDVTVEQIDKLIDHLRTTL